MAHSAPGKHFARELAFWNRLAFFPTMTSPSDGLNRKFGQTVQSGRTEFQGLNHADIIAPGQILYWR